jgi:sodium-dependent dicarboxylate transporter 2/3/5
MPRVGWLAQPLRSLRSLPVGTAPNAIVYGSGRVGLRDMMRAGLLVDILAVVLVVLVATVAVPWLE